MVTWASCLSFHESDKRQHEAACTNAWVYALAKHRRQDGWTSTPRASRGATAKQRRKLFSCLSWRPCDHWCLREDETGFRGMFSALRSVACLIACPPCPCSVFSRLPSPTWFVRGSSGPVLCPTARLPSLAVLLPAPSLDLDLPPTLCLSQSA